MCKKMYALPAVMPNFVFRLNPGNEVAVKRLHRTKVCKRMHALPAVMPNFFI